MEVERRYEHILVPLDGSEVAELALSHAFGLARLSRTQLTALHVSPPIEHVVGGHTAYTIFLDEQQEALEGRALRHLKSTCNQLTSDDVTVHTVVEVGLPAEAIIDSVTEHDIDLIVMSSHGHSGLKRWGFGSVADRVLRGADVPVPLARAHSRSKLDESR
jgi:nucleotide-binding universal stress UspA family protein